MGQRQSTGHALASDAAGPSPTAAATDPSCENDDDVRMLEQPRSQLSCSRRSDGDGDVLMGGADHPIPTIEDGPLTREQRAIARERIIQLHEIYLDTPGIDLVLRRIVELIIHANRDLHWNPILLANMQRIADNIGDATEEDSDDGQAGFDTLGVGPTHGPWTSRDGSTIDHSPTPGPSTRPGRGISPAPGGSITIGGFAIPTPRASPLGPAGANPVINNADEHLGERAPEDDLAAEQVDNAAAGASEDVPGGDHSLDPEQVDDAEAEAPVDEGGSAGGSEEPTPQPEPGTKRPHSSPAAQFWRPMINLHDDAQLALDPALAALLAQPAMAIFKDSNGFLYDMMTATREENNGEIYHQDIQMMIHVDERALQDRFRQMLCCIQLWYMHCEEAAALDWSKAARATLHYRERDALRLYDDWVQPHLPQQLQQGQLQQAQQPKPTAPLPLQPHREQPQQAEQPTPTASLPLPQTPRRGGRYESARYAGPYARPLTPPSTGRGRGRPRKLIPAAPPLTPPPAVRGRGRPRKLIPAAPPLTPPPAVRGRGRPRKTAPAPPPRAPPVAPPADPPQAAPAPAPAPAPTSLPRRPFVRISPEEFIKLHKLAVRAGKNYAWMASHLSFGALAHVLPLLPSHNSVATKMARIEGTRGTHGQTYATNALNKLRELDVVGLAERSGATAKTLEVLGCMTTRYFGRADGDGVFGVVE